MNGHLLLVRSLNYLLKQHTFTYLACRLMAETFHSDALDRWLDLYLGRKVTTGRRQVYWKYSLFKGMSASGQPEYRICLVASPTTQLAETWLLSRLSQEPAFRPRKYVYSYLWPHSHSGHIYQHFINGYRRRNTDIAAAAQAMPNSRIVVLDIKQFYPSIDKQRAIRRFRGRFADTSLSPQEIGQAVSLVEQLLSVPKVPGVPVGPALSHIIASIYLSEVDTILAATFPGRYFRYVDDLAVVVPEADVESAVALIADVLDKEGLKLNNDKKDVLPGDRWTHRTSVAAAGRADHGFGLLLHRLQVYLAHCPESGDELSTAFRDRGFCLPISRLRTVATYNPFRRFLRWALYRNPLSILWRAPQESPMSLVETAEQVRNAFRQDANDIAQHAIPPDGVERRWFCSGLPICIQSAYVSHPGRALSRDSRTNPGHTGTCRNEGRL